MKENKIFSLAISENNFADGKDILFILPDGITREQADQIDYTIQEKIEQYGEANDEDYADFNFYDVIENIFEDMKIHFKYPSADYTIYL